MTWLCSRGHIATTLNFAAAGITSRRLAAAVARGDLLRCRRGVYACPHLDKAQRLAARTGARLDCVSALARYEDLWTGPRSQKVHVRVHPRYHATTLPGAVLHWRGQHGAPTSPLEVGAVDALLQAMTCLSNYHALAAVESAMHLGYLDEAGLAQLLALAPERMQPTLRRIDLSSQSGFETFSRLQLVDAGHEVDSQVEIPGGGSLDLLVDGCVGIETDGEKWHADRFLADRTKDIRIEGWGIRVLRIGRPHIFEEWPTTLATVERMIADARRGQRTELRRLS